MTIVPIIPGKIASTQTHFDAPGPDNACIWIIRHTKVHPFYWCWPTPLIDLATDGPDQRSDRSPDRATSQVVAGLPTEPPLPAHLPSDPILWEASPDADTRTSR